MIVFSTRNVGLAALLRYLFGRSAHTATRLSQPRSAVYEFDDCEDRCRPVMLAYQRADGGSGYAVADSRTLVDEVFEVKRTVQAAIESGVGEWRNQL